MTDVVEFTQEVENEVDHLSASQYNRDGDGVCLYEGQLGPYHT